MANNVLNWVWDHSRSKHGARLVLLAIADRAHDDGKAAMSVRDIRRRTNLGDRAVQIAVTELAKMGELDVGYQEGPNGCNRYRVLMRVTPAESAPPPQILRGAEVAPLRILHPPESPQVNGQVPAESAPPADIAPPQISTLTPADFAGKPLEPLEKSSTKTSKGGVGGDSLFGAGDPPPPKRSRRAAKASPDPDFERWYATYPVHKARGDAEKAWAQVIRDGTSPETLIAAAQHYRDDDLVRRGYGKHPAGWLRAKCWLDEPASHPAANGRASPQRAPLPAHVSPKDEHRYRR